jgi:hypothetical protein
MLSISVEIELATFSALVQLVLPLRSRVDAGGGWLPGNT